MIAFAVSSQFSGDVMQVDSIYFRFVAVTGETISKNNVKLTFYPMQPCTEDEFSKFYQLEDDEEGDLLNEL